MDKSALAFTLILSCSLVSVAGEAKDKAPVDWWCDETECIYNEIPMKDNCDSNNSIPYRLNHTTGICELNLKGLLLSFRAINNMLGKITEERNRKRTEIIFRGVILSGKIFIGFASVCVFLACFHCCWEQYSKQQLRKSIKKLKLNLEKQNTGSKRNVKTGKIDKSKTITELEEVKISIV